ncbi:Protein RETICULATA-related [Arabidopsis thaliana x Arabidopsis arenosa]|uniref:Protein RETICULATA-related n=1 Tax=Arabidopsis thaliana x Arabidopsis arenosa TaxID=1240361 RepID=A0A8T1YVW2_9BRAS|nr:Protein RETICULATA-related [Arabidopsis thaliana x Arabidopsis arenosa]
MAIASCFFCVPTPNTSISESNLTWPHLASFPRLSSSSSFNGVITAKSISFNRRVPITPVLSASIDNGGSDNNGGGLGGGGGGGDGGKNDGDGHGDEDRDRNRNEAMLLLKESGTGLESLPKDLAAAIESGRIPGSVITRFLELQKSAVMRWLMQFGGFRERLLADDLFMAKLAMECGVGIFTKTAAEYERRRENFFNELEVVFADVAMAIIADFMLVYLPAPTVSLRPPLALTAGGISKFFHNCPDNAFQVALSGTSYTLLQRLGAITRNGAKLFAVGTTSSLVGTAITNAFIKARRAVDQTSEGEIETVPIVSTSVAYGVYMAVSSNLRYQIVAGVIEQRLLEPMLHQHKLALSALCFAVRTGNTFLGSLLWVDYARLIGIQKSH